jgi:N-acetylmuramoyl-L-alanine amidase/Secretion system C-terminal sorting domain
MLMFVTLYSDSIFPLILFLISLKTTTMKKGIIFLLAAFYFSAAFTQDEAKTLSFNFSKSNKKFKAQSLKFTTGGTSDTGSLWIKTFKMPLKKLDPFVSFTARLEGKNITYETLEVFYRKEGDKEWLPLSSFHEGEGNADIWVSNMLELDKSYKKIELKIHVKDAKTSIKNARFRFYCPGNVNTGDASGAGAGGSSLAGCAIPPSVSRQVWGANLRLTDNIFSGSPTFTVVTHLIVHHSAGSNTSSNWAATVASIFDYHVNTNGWSDVGYNWLIAPDGTLFVGRGGGNNVVGAHMCGYNNNTMGVCLLGTFTTVQPTQAALDKLAALLAWKSVESKIDPTGSGTIKSYSGTMNNISGHRDGCSPNYTECPGDMTYTLLVTLRTSVKKAVTACLTGTKEFSDLEYFKIYPNPNEGIFTLELRLKKAQVFDIVISDAIGRIIFSKKVADSETDVTLPLSLQNTAKGIYFIAVKNENQIKTQRFFVK